MIAFVHLTHQPHYVSKEITLFRKADKCFRRTERSAKKNEGSNCSTPSIERPIINMADADNWRPSDRKIWSFGQPDVDVYLLWFELETISLHLFGKSQSIGDFKSGSKGRAVVVDLRVCLFLFF